MKHKGKIWWVACLLLLCLTLDGSAALACGTIRMWLAGIQGNRALRIDPLECAASYKPPADDISIFRMMRKHGVRPEVFVNFNHLWGARHEPGYKDMVNKLPAYVERMRGAHHNPQRSKAGPGHDLTTYEQLAGHYRNWLVVSEAMGARLRQRPSLESGILASLRFGLTVERIGGQGDWLKVKCVGPGSIDPQYERQTGYVHKSLVKPY